MPLTSVTINDENNPTIPNLIQNPGDRVAGFRLSPEWYFRDNLKPK
jgi:hypothetical protein